MVMALPRRRAAGPGVGDEGSSRGGGMSSTGFELGAVGEVGEEGSCEGLGRRSTRLEGWKLA